MLIRFNVENFRSFQKEATLSMIPGPSKNYPHHIHRGDENAGFSTSRVAVLYGKNASGKSNLIKAMDFARDMIVEGMNLSADINRQAFRLDNETLESSTKLEFEFVTNGTGYAYGFSVTSKRIVEEWLYQITMENDTKLYERTTSEEGNTTIDFNFSAFGCEDEEEQGRLKYEGKSTRKNLLFLSASVDRNIPYFSEVYDWFDDSLIIVYPSSKPASLALRIHKEEDFKEKLSQFMRDMDTGIDQVDFNKVDKNSIPLPSDVLKKIKNNLTQENESDSASLQINSERYLVSLNDKKELEFQLLGTLKRRKDGSLEYFRFSEESDGTQRLLELFPIYYSQEQRIFVIDELERSLHPHLVKKLIRWFVDNKSNSQIIVTTHESTLLDQDLLRRDSYWFAEKSMAGASILYSLESFRVRSDLNYAKGYLSGRFGAIPIFGNNLSFQHIDDDLAEDSPKEMENA